MTVNRKDPNARIGTEVPSASPVLKEGKLPSGQSVTAQAASEAEEIKVLKVLKEEKSQEVPTLTSRVISALAGLLPTVWIEKINRIMSRFFPETTSKEVSKASLYEVSKENSVAEEVDLSDLVTIKGNEAESSSEFPRKSLSEFKGAVKVLDYEVPSEDNTLALIGAPVEVKELLSSGEIKELQMLTGKDGRTVGIPGQFARDIIGMNMNICGINNENTKDELSEGHNDRVISAYEGIEKAFKAEGITKNGLYAALECTQQGVFKGVSEYLCRIPVDDPESYLIKQQTPSIVAEFRGEKGNRVFHMEVDISVVCGRPQSGDVPFQKKEGLTVKRMIEIPVRELQAIVMKPKEKSLENGYTFSNLPKNITGEDRWSPCEPTTTEELTTWMESYSKVIEADPEMISAKRDPDGRCIEEIRQWIESYNKVDKKQEGASRVPDCVKKALARHSNKEVFAQKLPELYASRNCLATIFSESSRLVRKVFSAAARAFESQRIEGYKSPLKTSERDWGVISHLRTLRGDLRFECERITNAVGGMLFRKAEESSLLVPVDDGETVKLTAWMDNYSKLIEESPKSVSLDEVKQWIEKCKKAFDKPGHSDGMFFDANSIPAQVKRALVLHSKKEELEKEFPGIAASKDYLNEIYTTRNAQEGLRQDFERSLKGIRIFVETPESKGPEELALTAMASVWNPLWQAMTDCEGVAKSLMEFDVCNEKMSKEENQTKKVEEIIRKCREAFGDEMSAYPAVAKLLQNPDAVIWSKKENQNVILSEVISKMEELSSKMEKVAGDAIPYKNKVREARRELMDLKGIGEVSTKEPLQDVLVVAFADPSKKDEDVKGLKSGWQDRKRKDTAETIASWVNIYSRELAGSEAETKAKEDLRIRFRALYAENNTGKKITEKVDKIIKDIENLKSGKVKSRKAITKEIFVELDEKGKLRIVYNDRKTVNVVNSMNRELEEAGFDTKKTFGYDDELAYQLLSRLEGSSKEEKDEVLRATCLTVVNTPLEMLAMVGLAAKAEPLTVKITKKEDGGVFVEHKYVIKAMPLDEMNEESWSNVSDKNLYECNILLDVKKKLYTYSVFPKGKSISKAS